MRKTSEELQSFIHNTIENNSAETASIIIMEELYIQDQFKKHSNPIVIRSLSLPSALKKELNDLIDKHNLNLKTEQRNAIEWLTEIVRGFALATDENTNIPI